MEETENISPAKKLPLPLIIVAILVILGAVLAFYLTQQKPAIKQTVSQTPADTTPPRPTPLPTETFTGQAVSFKDGLLTLKKEGGQQIQIKVAPEAAILKQKQFGPGSMGTVPAEVKPGDNISVTATKNVSGELSAYSIVIMLKEFMPKEVTPSTVSDKTK